MRPEPLALPQIADYPSDFTSSDLDPDCAIALLGEPARWLTLRRLSARRP